MNTNRRGKIARLPRETRLELNCRLDDGEPGGPVLAWLNDRPEVRETLAAQFGGRAVSERNLSEWRLGGYRDWRQQQEALELAERLGEEAEAWEDEGRRPMSETLSFWLAARYTVATRRIAKAGDVKGWRLLREMCRDVARLRRGDQRTWRLTMQQEEHDRGNELLELERERTRRKSEAEHEEWARQPENIERMRRKKEAHRERLQEIRYRMWGPVSKGLEPGDRAGAAYTAKVRAQEAAEAVEEAVRKAEQAAEEARYWEAAANGTSPVDAAEATDEEEVASEGEVEEADGDGEDLDAAGRTDAGETTPLVPKLQLGNAPVFEVPASLPRPSLDDGRHREAGVMQPLGEAAMESGEGLSKQSFGDKAAPKLELGSEGSEAAKGSRQPGERGRSEGSKGRNPVTLDRPESQRKSNLIQANPSIENARPRVASHDESSPEL